MQSGFFDILIGLIPAVVGLVLFIRGIAKWPRNRGDTPYCGNCNYNLTGLTSDRCPECGTIMSPDMIVYGQGYRRGGMIVAGCICIALGIGCFAGGITRLQKVNWYQYRPTAWVLNDLQSSSRTTAQKAWKEVQRRIQARRLSASQHEKLIDVCLQEQAAEPSGPIMQDLIDHIGFCYVDGRLSEIQKRTFFEQMVKLQLVIRPKVMTCPHFMCQ